MGDMNGKVALVTGRIRGIGGYGRIVTISSVVGSACNIGRANHAAARSGIFGLTGVRPH